MILKFVSNIIHNNLHATWLRGTGRICVFVPPTTSVFVGFATLKPYVDVVRELAPGGYVSFAVI